MSALWFASWFTPQSVPHPGPEAASNSVERKAPERFTPYPIPGAALLCRPTLAPKRTRPSESPMSYTLILSTQATASIREVSPENALAEARAAWEGGEYVGVRVLTETGLLYWKRSAAPGCTDDAADQAALTAAAGLTQLALACPEISGLADLHAPLDPGATSFEVIAGPLAPGHLFTAETARPKVRDLLRFLDAQLSGPATLEGWTVSEGPWPNPAHCQLSVSLVAREAV